MNCVLSENITREANISGRVTYLPLDKAGIWADVILSMDKSIINNTKSIAEKGYSLDKVVDEFIRLCF